MLKRVESYRIKNELEGQQQTLLLPVSGGVSSIVLLHILDALYQRRLAIRGHSTFQLHVLSVRDASPVDNAAIHKQLLQSLRDRYPLHHFSSLSFNQVFSLDDHVHEALTELGFLISPGQEATMIMDQIMTLLSTSTSRSEIRETLFVRLVVAFAKLQGCKTILWGHSDSRLAARALSSVATGHGAALPFLVADGSSSWGLHFYYPLRDVLKSELTLYAAQVLDNLTPLTDSEHSPAEVATPIRKQSIGGLLASYVNSQGDKYPSIMANVVRTSSKLQPPAMSQMMRKCVWCATLFESTEAGKHMSSLCYGCTRTKQDILVLSTVW